MTISNQEFEQISLFLKENNFSISNFLPSELGNGQSNPTYLITDISDKKYVLRSQPKGELVRGAHRLDREFSVLKGLFKKKFYTPKPYILCTEKSIIGRDFYIMEFIEGSIYEDPFLPDNSPDQKNKIYQSLAKTLGLLHSYNEEDLDIPFKRSEGFLKRNLNLWFQQIFNENNHDQDIEKVYNFIIAKFPENKNLSLLHGDYKLDNLVINNKMECSAVLDWELSAFGEPEADLSFQMINWLLPKGVLYGIGLEWKKEYLPSAEVFLGWYEESYGKSVNLENLNIACLYSLMKLYCILKGIENRVKSGNAASDDAMEKVIFADDVKEALLNAFQSYPKNLIIN